MTFLAASATAFAAAILLTPVARRIAIRFDILDHPGERKVHADPVPYLGGLAIIVAVLLAVAVARLVTGFGLAGMPAILGGAGLMAAMGLWDDLRVVPGWVKFIVMTAGAVLLWSAGIRVHLFRMQWLDFALTWGWITGITNAVNFLDNQDGLTAGVSAIAGASFFVLATHPGQAGLAALSAALAGSALGFGWHNRAPARIFMGDAGSLFLGFLLAAIGLRLRFENIARVSVFVPIAVLGVPVLDTLLVTTHRVRRGLSPLRPGKDHISHRLIRVGVRPTIAVAILWVAAAVCGGIGIAIARTPPRTAYVLFGAVVTAGAACGALLWRVSPD